MKISMIIHGGWRNPHAGAVRPIFSWARGLDGHEVTVEMINAGGRLLDHARGLGIRYRNYKDAGALAKQMEAERPDIVFGDDSVPIMKACGAIRAASGAAMCTYAQLLLGSQSIVDPIDSRETTASKIVRHGLSRLVPFSAFRIAYKRLLGKDNSVICNSRSTATLLQVLYGIEPEGVVYPPVDDKVFFPRKKRGKGALLYIGSYGLDSDPRFLRSIIGRLHEAGEEVALFGNRELGAKLSREHGGKEGHSVRFIDGCTDEELAGEYSSAALTICPQKWELFGYVVAESISCGTPVLAFDCMGPGEILSRHGGGVLVNRKEEFLGALKDIDASARSAPRITLDGEEFTLKKSSASLLAVLERVLARGGQKGKA